MRESGEALVQRLGITKVLRVLDLGCGDGTTTMNAFEAAEKQGRATELQKQLEELFNNQNKSQDGTSIPATFLRVTVSV